MESHLNENCNKILILKRPEEIHTEEIHTEVENREKTIPHFDNLIPVENLTLDNTKPNFYNKNRNFKAKNNNRPYQRKKWVWIFCNICNVKSNNEYNHKLHLASLRHREREKLFDAEQLNDMNNNSPQVLNTTNEIKSTIPKFEISTSVSSQPLILDCEDKPFPKLNWMEIIFLLTMVYFGICLILYICFVLIGS